MIESRLLIVWLLVTGVWELGGRKAGVPRDTGELLGATEYVH